MLRFKHLLQRISIGRRAVYRYDQQMVRFSPLLFVFVFLSLLILTSSQNFINTQLASAANGNIYPDSDTTAQFANSTGANHFGEIDEATLNTGGAADYINTGTGGNSGSAEVEEYTMTSIAGPIAPVTSVQVYIYAYAQGGCNSACDQLNVQISIDGGAFTAANSVTLTGTSQELAVTAFTGSWTGDDDVSVRITRGVNGSGNPNNQDDDVRIDRVRADVTYTPVASLDQTHYRWRDDSSALNTSAGWLAAEDAKPASTDTRIDDVLRLRMQVNNPSAIQGIQGFRLQWAVKGASCSASTGWTRIDTASDAWELTASTQYADGAAITGNLLTAGTVFVNGEAMDTDSSGDDTSANIQLDQNDYTEVEWAIRATSNALEGSSYCFRVVDNGGSIISTYTNYPEVTLFVPVVSLITQEAYIWEYDNGTTVDSNDQQDVADTAIAGLKKGERLNLRAHLKNLGSDSETDNLALFYDRGDNIWTKVVKDQPNTPSGSGCADSDWICAIVDTGNTDTTGYYSTLAIDKTGTPWIASVNSTNNLIDIARYVGSGGTGCSGNTEWTCSTVTGIGSVGGSQIGFAFDEDNTPWLSWMTSSGTNLYVARWVGSGGTGCTPTTWDCTLIENNSGAGWYTSLSIGPDGNPWVSYVDNVSELSLRVARYLGGATTGTGCSNGSVNTWTCEAVVDDSNDYGQETTSIAIDPSGAAWVSYHDDTNGDLYVAQYVGSGGSGCTSSAWTCTAVATANDSGDIGTSIAISPDGNPVIAYREVSTGGDLMYAEYLGGATTGTGCATNTWNCITIDSTNDVGAYAKVAFDAAGNPWIVYRDTTSTNPRVARYLGGATTGTGCATNTWSCINLLTDADNDGAFPSIAFDSNGNPWVSYWNSTDGSLGIGTITRSGEFTVSHSVNNNNGEAIAESHADIDGPLPDATDRDDIDCISASNWNDGIHSTFEELVGLNLPAGDVTSQCTEVSWTLDTSQTTQGETYRFAIATKDGFDASRNEWRGPVQIDEYPTLTIEADTELRAAKATNPIFTNCALDTSWGCQTIHSTNNVGNESYIKFSPEGVPWISYQDTTANDLWVANYVGSGGNCDTLVAGSDAWQCTLVEATGTVAYFTSLNFDKEGNPWVAYSRGITSNLDLAVARYVGSGGTGCGGGSTAWTCESIATTNHIGSYVSIAFDESGTAMISYRDETGGDLEFARYVGSGGNCDTVAAGSDGWDCYTIDATNNVGYTTAMEVAGDGTIWIAYQDFTAGSVKVAKYVGGGGNCDATGGSDAWQCTTVDDRGVNVLGYDIDIAIDSQGRPWIAHLDNTGADLELVRYVGGGTGNCNSVGTGSADWFCESIQVTNNVGYTPGIAIDSNDTAWVSFGDNSTQRLRVAKYVGNGGSCAGLGGSASWNCGEVQTASGYYSSIDIDPNGVPWISHTTFAFADLFITKLDLPPSPLSANRGGPQIPSGDAKYRLDGLGYGDILTDDSALDIITGNVNDTLLYTFEKEGITSGSKPIEITWTGQSDIAFGTNNAFLQIYRYGSTNAWETLVTESACAANTDCTITATVSSNVSQYTNNGLVSVRIYQDDHTTTQNFKTDFIDIKQPLNPDITQEAYIWENDDGTDADTNTQQAAGNTARTGVVKGERINLRTHVKNTGDSAPTDYALFYDRGDGLWSKVSNDAPLTTDGSCDDLDFDCTNIAQQTGLGEYSSIAVDSNGNPWVSFYDNVNQNLEVAQYVGSGGNCDTLHTSGSDAWQCTVVDATGDVGSYSSIAIGPDDSVWVAYRDVGDLGVARYVGSGGNCDLTGGSDAWECTAVDVTNTVGFFTSITVDASGSAWVSYQDGTNYNLDVAKYVGSGGNCDSVGAGSDAWECWTVDVTGDVGWNTSIAIDANGTPWVSHADETVIGDANLEVAKYVGSGGNCDSVGAGSDAWQCTVIESTNNVGFYSSIAIAPDGNPWISYTHSTNADLKVAEFVSSAGNCENSAEWNCSVVDSTDNVGYYTSIAFGPNGNPAISYFDDTNDDLGLAYYVGSGGNCDTVGAGSDAWQCSAVETTGQVGAWTSLSYAPNGQIMIAHREFTASGVNFTVLNRESDITPSPSLSATNGDALSESHADMTTTVDTTNRDDADCVTGGATWNNGFFSTEEEISQLSIPNGETTVQCTELNFSIDTSQALEGETYRFVVATKDSWRPDKGTWRGPIAITQYPTLTIEADTNQRVSKAITPTFTGCDSYNAGSSGSPDWSCVIVDDQTAAIGGNPQSIAFDSENTPWLAYGDMTNFDLMVAKYVGSGGNCDTYDTGSSGSDAWECTVIAGDGINAGGSPSIAFDPSGTPWIASNTNANVMISKYVGSGGNCDTFDTATSGSDAWECYYVDDPISDSVGVYASLTFTDSGIPWISYKNNTDVDMYVANYVGSGGNCDSYEAGAAGSDAWNCTRVDATNDVGDWSDLVIDDDNIPWISYKDNSTPLSVKVAKYVGSGGNCDVTGGSDAWQCTVVDDQTDTLGSGTAITSSSDGTITVVYQNQTDGSLVSAEYVGSGGNCDTYAAGSTGSDAWQCTVIDDQTTTVGWDVESVVGPDDAIWIVYQGLGGSNTHVARYVGSGGNCNTYAAGSTGSGAWQCTIVDQSSDGLGDFPNIAVDNSGIPWLIYQNWSDGSIVVAKSIMPPGPLGENRSGPLAPSGDAAYRLDDIGYSDVASDDNALDDIVAPLNQIPFYSYSEKFTLGNKFLEVSWTGQSTVSMATNNTKLEIYNYSSNSWETLATENSCAADTDCTITGTTTSKESYYNFNNGKYDVNIRVSQAKHSTNQTLKTDTFNIVQITEPKITQKSYIIENDDGTSADTNTPKVAGATSVSEVRKGERLNIRTQIENTGEGAPSDYALFYDRGDNIWTQVENNKPVSSAGSGCDTDANSIGYLCTDIFVDAATHADIAFDNTGNPWVTFDKAGTNFGLWSAQYVGSDGTGCASSSWTCQRIESSVDRPSMAIDPSGNPWVSYYDYVTDDLNIAQYVGSGGTGCDISSAWTCTTIDATNDVGAISSIAFDPSGNPWISYYDTTNSDLRIAQYVGSGGTGCAVSTWTCVVVDTVNYTLLQNIDFSIAFDSNGVAWLSYYYETTFDLRIAQYVGSGGTGCASSSWTCVTVASAGASGLYSSIAIDPSGNPWVSYWYQSFGDLYVAQYVGSGGTGCATAAWQCSSVDTTNTVGQSSDIAFDSSGRAWVSYQDSTNGALRTAQYVGSGGTGCSSSAWSCLAVDSTGGSFGHGWRSSIAFDTNGNPWVTHISASLSDLRVSRLSRQAEITLSPSLAASNGDSLSESHTDMTTVIDTTNRDDADCITGGATWNNGLFINIEEIENYTIPQGTVTTQCTELNWSIDTSQALENTTYRFVVATKDNWRPDKGVWRGPIQIDNYPQITIKADSSVRYSKASTPGFSNCDTDTDWGCVTVDSGNAAGNTLGANSAVAIDSKGTAWVSYEQADSSDLLAAKYVGVGGNCDVNGGSAAWQCWTIAATNEIIVVNTDIVIDNNDTPWIYTFDTTLDAAIVAKYVGSGGNCDGSSEWQCFTVDNDGVVGDYGSITIGKNNVPWIAYRDADSGGLKVARYVGSGGNCTDSAWSCESIVNGSSGYNARIVNDQTTGKTWVSHYSTTGADLMMAEYVGSGGTGCLVSSWNCYTVDTGGANDVGGTGTDIAINENGTPYISYFDATTGSLKIASYVGTGGSCTSTEWNCSQIETGSSDGAYSSIAFDSNNRAWVSYKENSGTAQNLEVAVNVGGSSGSCTNTAWDCTTIDSTGNIGLFTSIAFDPSDTPWISYYDGTNLDLKVAKLHIPKSPLSADKGGNFIQSGDMQYRLDGGQSPFTNNAGICGGTLASNMGYCGIFDNQGDYDSVTTLANESPIYAGAVKFDSNTELPKIVWEGRTDVAPNTAGTAGDLALHIYRFGTTNDWETIASDSTSSDCNTADCTLTGSGSGTVSEYFEQEGSEYWVYFRVYQESHTTAINFKVDKFSAQITDQRLRGGRIFEDGVRKPLLTE